MRTECDWCALAFQREDAHFVGAMAINIVVTEILFGVLLIGWAAVTWPDPPWTLITLGAVALNALAPIVFYPTSKSLWTAIDLAMHRLDPVDRTTIEL